MSNPLSLTELRKNAAMKELKAKMPGVELTDASIKAYHENIKLLNEMMSTKGASRGPKISMKEALESPDVSILFPKVISDVLLRPREPLMIGHTLLCKTVQVDGTRSVEFPVLGALRAFEVGETGEYREQLAPFAESITEIKVKKWGLLTAISQDVIDDSMWDVLALYLEAAGFAMLRKKEENIFNEFKAHLHPMFDNASTNPKQWTSARDIHQALNYGVHFDDMIYALGGLVANEYVPTDVVMHPLAWVIFATDPIIRNIFYTQGQIGQTVWTNVPDFDQQSNMPWNIKYQVTPFVPFSYETTLATGPASGLSAANISDIYFIDRNNAAVVLEREAMSIDQFDKPERDIKLAKLSERYGVGVVNGGRAGVAMKNVRLVQNFSPVFAQYAVSPP